MSTGIQALHAALAKAQEDGTLTLMAPHLHPNVIRAFCETAARLAEEAEVKQFRDLANGELFKFAASRDGFFKDLCLYRKASTWTYTVIGGTGHFHVIGSTKARVVPQKEIQDET